MTAICETTKLKTTTLSSRKPESGLHWTDPEKLPNGKARQSKSQVWELEDGIKHCMPKSQTFNLFPLFNFKCIDIHINVAS